MLPFYTEPHRKILKIVGKKNLAFPGAWWPLLDPLMLQFLQTLCLIRVLDLATHALELVICAHGLLFFLRPIFSPWPLLSSVEN